ncbi:MAG: transposase [Bacteroidetes bacterium]|nr:transposase [Bacteroidota bacterium]MCL2302465.1 transposase [Lentimicrobiaceae bacterium]
MTKSKHYNPNIHHRHSFRLKGYDYSQAGLYFITICVQNHRCLLGKIIDGKIELNEYGKIVEECWLEITQHYPDCILHEFVVMPNHLHGIIELTKNGVNATVGVENFRPHENNDTQLPVGVENFRPLQRPNCKSRSIGAIVRGFKIGTTKRFHASIWQRYYWEHIIRNNDVYQRIANYIIHNPVNWGKDKFYTR